ncbi:MAG: DUF1800 domain-containing protein [Aquabacterium sp.]
MTLPALPRRGLCLGLWAGLLGAGLAVQACSAVAATSEAQALHVLQRLSFGPAPGDLAHVQSVGIDRYIDEQLHPERLALPAALSQRLSGMETLGYSQRDLVQRFRQANEQAKNDKDEGKLERRQFFQQVAGQAAEARLIRAIQSPRQLEEVMVDFWFNHFNVFQGKGLDRVLMASYEQDAIRPHVFGRFRDLLGATAHHPAMLYYLDNWLSAAPGYQAPKKAGALGKVSGLNENYARELMELHTLGVDGGYTQKDVTELARMLTGWTLRPQQGRRMAWSDNSDAIFYFDARRHDEGDKDWLGKHVGARGQAEGEWALDVLAAHPATAHHVAYELAQYFVADQPPTALVDRLAKRFLDTDGDIRAVLTALFDSAEFRDPHQAASKFKTPYQYVISAVRAGAVPVVNTKPLLASLYQFGMPLYGCQTPDGYKHTEQAWLNPDAITRRIGFATALAAGKLPLAKPVDEQEPGPMGVKSLARVAERMDEAKEGKGKPNWGTPPLDAAALLGTLGDAISARTRATVEQADAGLKAAMVLGSPDFMRY